MKNMQKINCDMVAIVHRFFSEGKRKRGGFDKILDYFSAQGKTILLIEHPLTALKEGKNNCHHTIVSLMKNGELKELETREAKSRINVLNWVYEVIFNVKYLRRVVGDKVLFAAVDPLNGLAGIICRHNFAKMYYHCIDYSTRRFDNYFLNKFYRFLLWLNLKNFDVIGVVSLRIKEELEKITDCSSKIIYLPNSPIFKTVDLTKKNNPVLICTGGAIIPKYNYDFIVDLIADIKLAFPSIKLYAIGGLDEQPDYVQKLHNRLEKLSLKDNIIFTGFLLPDQLENFLVESKIGLSFYDKNAAYYMYFGGPLKTREYALYGIPSITDGSSATDEETVSEGAGFIVKNLAEAKEKIALLLNNDHIYKNYQKNCIAWAQKNDKLKLLNSLYTKLS